MAASAGNHAQGVALACALLGIQAHIFMPKSTPLQKVEAVRFFGKEKVRIYLLGENYDEAFAASRKFCETNGAIYIPPFDDYDIIAGQATVTLEILQALPEGGPKDLCYLSERLVPHANSFEEELMPNHAGPLCSQKHDRRTSRCFKCSRTR